MKYDDRICVLNSEIPTGGRNLTSSECKRIRQYGYSCSERYFVMRAFDSPFHGILYRPYRPSKGGGLDHAGIYVETAF